MSDIRSTDDTIDMHDLIERFEELRDELIERHEAGGFMSDFDDWINNSRDNSAPTHAAFPEDGAQVQEDIEEFFKLRELLDDLKVYGGDVQWEGDWYPNSLIHERHFVDAMKELCEDIGDFPKDIPSYYVIDWEATADNLRVDYRSTEFDGQTFWYR
jgi:antirestriction protein